MQSYNNCYLNAGFLIDPSSCVFTLYFGKGKEAFVVKKLSIVINSFDITSY